MLDLFDELRISDLPPRGGAFHIFNVIRERRPQIDSRENNTPYVYTFINSWSDGFHAGSIEQFKIIPPGMSLSSRPDKMMYITIEEALFLNINYGIPILSVKDFWPDQLTAATAFSIVLPSILELLKVPSVTFTTGVALPVFGVLFAYCVIIYPLFYRYIIPGFNAKLGGVIPGFQKNPDISLKDLMMEGSKIFLSLGSAVSGLTLGGQWAADYAPMIATLISSLTTSGFSTIVNTLVTAAEHRGKNWSSPEFVKYNIFQAITGFSAFAGLVEGFQLLQGVFAKCLPALPWSAMPLNILYILIYALFAGRGAPIANEWFVKKLLGQDPLSSDLEEVVVVSNERTPLLDPFKLTSITFGE